MDKLIRGYVDRSRLGIRSLVTVGSRRMALWVETFPPFSPDLERALCGSHIGITANPVVIGPFFNGEPVAWHNTRLGHG